MKQLFVVLCLILAGVAALEFCRGWFTASSGETAHGVNISVGVDQDRIRDDEAAVKEKLTGIRGTAEVTERQTGTAPDRRP